MINWLMNFLWSLLVAAGTLIFFGILAKLASYPFMLGWGLL